MPKLDGSVGQGAENRRHDVAVVQAALGKARLLRGQVTIRDAWHDADYRQGNSAG